MVMVLENTEEEAFGNQEKSEEYEEDEDAEEVEEGEEEVRGAKEGAPDSEVAQDEETSEEPSKAPPVQTNVVAAKASGEGFGSEKDGSEQEYVPNSHAQDHTISEK